MSRRPPAAPPPVDVGVWGTWGFVAPPRVPGLEQVKRFVRVEMLVVRGAAEQVGEIALETAKFGVLNLTTLGGYGTYKLGRALWDGYKGDGAVGAANALNPIYTFLKNGGRHVRGGGARGLPGGGAERGDLAARGGLDVRIAQLECRTQAQGAP